MTEVKFYNRYPALEQVLALYFNNQLEDEEVGKNLASHFVSKDAVAKVELRAELIAIMGTGDALRFFTEYPYAYLVDLPEDSSQAADTFLIGNVWNYYWPTEPIPHL